jgi:hypothetical protein
MSAPPSTSPIQRSARRFRRFAYLAAFLALLCVGSEVLLALSPIWHGGNQVAALWNGFGQLVLAVPVLCLVWGLSRARRLFRRIEGGDVFAPENSRDFKRVGWWIVAGATWSLTISGMVPPMTGAVAQQLAGLGMAGRDLALLALGFGLVVIGQVVAEARRLKVDNDSFL